MNLIELAQSIGLDTKWQASTAGGEYSSACPRCGGKDRFRIQPHKQQKNCIGRYFCRQCNAKGDSIQFCRDFLGDSFRDALEHADANIEQSKTSFSAISKSLNKERIPKPYKIDPPSDAWKTRAGRFVGWAHHKLLDSSPNIEYLTQRGLPLEAVKRYKIGLTLEESSEGRGTWGLPEEQKENGIPKTVWIPKGIVIPTCNQNSEVLRIKIRRSNYQEGDERPKYIVISGSANGLNIIGDKSLRIMLVVESELDAYALHYVLGDIAVIVAVGSNIKNPDNVTDFLAKNSSTLLICHDNDEAGKKMYDKWRSLYSHSKACPTPIGKDIGEAVQRDLNIREWILHEIK